MRIDVNELPVPVSVDDAIRRRTELTGKVQLIQSELGAYAERRKSGEPSTPDDRCWRKRATDALAWANAELKVIKHYLHQQTSAPKPKAGPEEGRAARLAAVSDLTELARTLRDYTKAYTTKVYAMEQELIRLRAENDQLREQLDLIPEVA